MLRAIVVLLLAANVVFFAWTQGWLAPLAQPPLSSEREPDRMRQQVRPESVTVLGPKAVTQARQADAAARNAEAADAERRAASAASAARAAQPVPAASASRQAAPSVR